MLSAAVMIGALGVKYNVFQKILYLHLMFLLCNLFDMTFHLIYHITILVFFFKQNNKLPVILPFWYIFSYKFLIYHFGVAFRWCHITIFLA